jgi:hypothetical protein
MTLVSAAFRSNNPIAVEDPGNPTQQAIPDPAGG